MYLITYELKARGCVIIVDRAIVCVDFGNADVGGSGAFCMEICKYFVRVDD